MPNEPDPKLERLIDEELRRLPPVAAPDNLIPRVRAAIAARANLPWWQQPWVTWPAAARLGSAVLLLSGMGYAGYLAYQFTPGTSWSLDGMAERFSGLSWVWEVLATLGSALVFIAQSLETYFIWIGAGLLLATYLSCVGLGTLCFRLAYQKR